jgi:HK97 family phage major capsid protein
MKMSTSTNRYDSPLPTADYDPWRNEFVRSHSTMKPSEQFNLRNAINAIVHKDDVVAKKEFEISKRLSIKMGRSPGTFGFHAPASALLSQRLITTGSPANGSNLIPTELLSDLFVYTLREETLVGRLGLSSIASDGADLDIPKFNTDTSAYWLADENATITASAPVFGQLHITPKVVAGIVTVSHKLLKQSSPSVDQIMQDDLRLSVSEAVDAAVLQGTGSSGQPEGLLNNSGVEEIEMPSGEDTGVSHLMDMMSTLAVNKAMRGRMRFVVNPADAVLLAQRQRFSSTDTPLLEGSLNDAMVLGIPAVVTNYCPQGTIILGDFSEMYLASYGGIEVLIDPFTDANKGAVSIRALAMVDVAVRRPESFVKLTSVV